MKVLAMRRRRARAAMVMALATAFLAGRLSVALPVGGTESEGSGDTARVQQAESDAPSLPERREDAPALEARAGSAPASDRAALFEQAGDRYLQERGDVASALRCYAEVLRASPLAEGEGFDASDSWLLAALKRGHP